MHHWPPMTLAPLINAPFAIQIHAFAAITAFAVGLIQLTAPKGTIPHRLIGWSWAVLMLTVAISSLFIHEIRHAQPNKVRTVIKRTALSLDPYYHPSTTRIARFKLRDLLLLNICRMNTQAGVRASLRQRLTAWRAKLACRVSDELIAEFIHRL